MLNLGDGGVSERWRARKGDVTFYRHPMRFGRGLWELEFVVGQKRRRKEDSDSVEVGLVQPLGRGRGRKGRTERVGGRGREVGVVVRESRGLKYLYLYAT